MADVAELVADTSVGRTRTVIARLKTCVILPQSKRACPGKPSSHRGPPLRGLSRPEPSLAQPFAFDSPNPCGLVASFQSSKGHSDRG